MPVQSRCRVDKDSALVRWFENAFGVTSEALAGFDQSDLRCDAQSESRLQWVLRCHRMNGTCSIIVRGVVGIIKLLKFCALDDIMHPAWVYTAARQLLSY